jgi:hypothetical protein
LEDVGHGGGVQMAGVEEAEIMAGMEEMEEDLEVLEDLTVIKGIKNDVRKEKRASLQRRLHEFKLCMNKGGYKMKKLFFE